METAERVFPNSEDQFDLPPPGIQENDLMCGQVEAIGQQAELMAAGFKTVLLQINQPPGPQC